MRRLWTSIVMRRIAIAVACLCVSASSIAQDKVRLLYFSSFPEIMQKEGEPGLSQLAELLEQERAANPNTLFIHGGASLGPSVFGAMDNGAHMIDILNAMAPDVMAVGKREFSYGYDNFILNALSATFPMVTSNMVTAEANTPIDGTYPNFVLEAGNIAIGVIALTSANAVAEYGAVQANALSAAEAVSENVQVLRDELVDVIVLLADTDYDDLSEFREQGLVDIIIYTHNFDNPQSLDVQGTIVKNGALDGVVLAVDLWKDTAQAPNGLMTSVTEIPLASYESSPLLAPIIETYQSRLDQILGRGISTVTESFDTFRSNIRSRENGFANLVTDALRDHLRADAMILNGGSIRGNVQYETGYEINRGDIQRELPFGNRSALLSISGAAIIETLEHGIDCGLREDGCFVHVSNLAVRYDSNKPKGQRVVSVEIGGAPLQETALYRVAVSDFMAGGNDGFTALAEAERLANEGTNQLIWNTVVRFVEKMPELSPKVEGRILDVATQEAAQQ